MTKKQVNPHKEDKNAVALDELVATDNPPRMTPTTLDIGLSYTAEYRNSTGPQEFWIRYFNERKQLFASMPDYYETFKQLRIIEDQGTPIQKAKAKEILSLLRDGEVSVTSTRLIPDKKGNVSIVHNHGSEYQDNVKMTKVKIPELGNSKYGLFGENLLATDKGLKFMQALLGTDDNAEEILQTFAYSGKIKYTDGSVKLGVITISNYENQDAKAAGFYMRGHEMRIKFDDPCTGKSIARRKIYIKD